MKTDDEFIAGIYEKAKMLEKSDNSDIVTFKEVSSNYTKKPKLQLVASLVFVLFTGIGYSSGNFNTVLSQDMADNYQSLESDLNPMVRTAQPMSTGASDLHYNPIEQAEVICTAKVSKIEESIYDQNTNSSTTNVFLQTLETIKGTISEEFQLLLVDTLDDLTTVSLVHDEEVLLFLETSYNDMNLYILTGTSHGKYSLKNDGIYENHFGIQYTINDLKTHFGLEN